MNVDTAEHNSVPYYALNCVKHTYLKLEITVASIPMGNEFWSINSLVTNSV